MKILSPVGVVKKITGGSTAFALMIICIWLGLLTADFAAGKPFAGIFSIPVGFITLAFIGRINRTKRL